MGGRSLKGSLIQFRVVKVLNRLLKGLSS